MNNLETSAQTVGNLYAISTVGSIVGTFLSGFFLIPFWGTNKLLIIIAVTLIITSIILFSKKYTKIKLVIILIAIISWGTINKISIASEKEGFIDVDTAYNRIWIHKSKDKNGQTTRVMGINNENHSSMFLNSEELVNEYTKYYDLAKNFKPDFKKTLMLGGAGYSYPKSFLVKYPEATMDVVEIDPKITELAKKYFRLKDDPRLTIYHEDGRVYLNKTKEKYDVIFGDAFSSRYSLPYQLTTKEAVQKKFETLNNDGIVILNIISSLEGAKGKFLRAEFLTYKSIFPQVYLFPVTEPKNPNLVQNIILVALKSPVVPNFRNNDSELNDYLSHLWKEKINEDVPILTDDFSPVDYYINKAL